MNLIMSIIIPCYNSDRFINNTIKMLLCQDLSDCELILVDDGSIDSTLQVLQKYESSDSNVRVISQLNQGVSAARNTGMLAARGKYIYFLDSDDTLTEGTLLHFKQVIREKSQCQMFAFGYEARRNNVRSMSYVFPNFNKQIFSGYMLLRNFLCKRICCHICSCIYDREFLLNNNLTFKQGMRIGEDILFLLQVMSIADKVYYSDRVSFIYQIRDDSTMQGYKSYSDDQYESHIELRKFLLPIAVRDKSISNYVNFFLLFSYISNLKYYLCSSMKSNELNTRFLIDGIIRYKKNYVGNIPYWFAMKLIALLPLGLILKILKT